MPSQAEDEVDGAVVETLFILRPPAGPLIDFVVRVPLDRPPKRHVDAMIARLTAVRDSGERISFKFEGREYRQMQVVTIRRGVS